MLDGRDFKIVLADGRSMRLTDVSGVPGIKSENPAFLEWVYRVIRAVDASAGTQLSR